MDSIDNLKIKQILEETKDINLVVASKYIDEYKMLELFKLGIHNFGENRVDSFISKYETLKDYPIIWHFIGHLQTNKARLVLNKIEYLHSLDSLKLASLIDKYCTKPLKCFVEINMTLSNTKNGIKLCDLDEFLNALKQYKKVEVIGLMTMTEKNQNNKEKYEIFKSLKEVAKKHHLQELSMGMSDDYKEAIKAGATYVRLGRIICF